MVKGYCLMATLAVLVPLVSVLFYAAWQGFPALNWDFFTKLPKPVGESGGGMANAIVGSFTLVGMACLIGIPAGVLAGVYLSEFGDNKFGWLVRFFCDVMSGVPSIVVGIFAYTLLVLPMKRFSALAGSVALGIIMIPTVTRTTEELVRLIPGSLREAALALGVPQWKTIVRVVLPAAASGIATGIMLAVARIAGETAPLLFTALNNRFWQSGLDKPIASLPVQIFTYAIAPYDDWHAQAWGAALVLIMLVFCFNISAQYFARRFRK